MLALIKPGKDESKRLWRGTCEKCEAIFEASEDELNNLQKDQEFSWENCPWCKRKSTMLFKLKDNS